jgi:hypothetical protein
MTRDVLLFAITIAWRVEWPHGLARFGVAKNGGAPSKIYRFPFQSDYLGDGGCREVRGEASEAQEDVKLRCRKSIAAPWIQRIKKRLLSARRGPWATDYSWLSFWRLERFQWRWLLL